MLAPNKARRREDGAWWREIKSVKVLETINSLSNIHVVNSGSASVKNPRDQ